MVGEHAKLLEGWGNLRSDQKLTTGSTVRVYVSGEHGEEAPRTVRTTWFGGGGGRTGGGLESSGGRQQATTWESSGGRDLKSDGGRNWGSKLCYWDLGGFCRWWSLKPRPRV
jgi:hypothetical protein